MKKIILFLVVVSLLVMPAMAETINYDYGAVASGTTHVTKATSSYSAITTVLNIEHIETYTGLISVVGGVEGHSGLSKDYYDTPFTATISGAYVGSGTYAWNRHRVDGVVGREITIAVVFDDIDVLGMSGAKTIVLTLDDPSVAITAYKIDGNYPSCGPVYAPDEGYVLIGEMSSIQCRVNQDTTVYSEISFHQDLEYTVNANAIDVSFNKYGYANEVLITDGITDLILVQTEKADDIIQTFYTTELDVSVTNPYLVDTAWENTIPEAADSSPQDPAEFTAYIYDAKTGNLISWSYLNKTYSGVAPLPTTTYDPDGVIQDVVYWEDTDYAVFTAGATGYETTTTTYNYTALTAPAGSTDNVMSFQLVPSASIGNSSYALSFFVSQEISSNSEVYTRAVDASVNCGGVEHLTGPAGTTWFNVSAGDLEYTVSKNGFETVQGNVSVSGNTLETVYLSLGPEVPTISDEDEDTGDIDPEAMHEDVAEAYAQFGDFIPEAVMIACVLFLLSMFKKF